MVAVKSMPLGPPMGGQMGPPPGAPVQMPNTGGPPPMNMAPPPVGGVPQAAQGSAPLSTQVSGYGGSASGRAKFKGALSARKNAFMAKQTNMSVPPIAPSVGAPPSFGQFAGGPMAGAPMGVAPMGPVPPMPMGDPSQVGRVISLNNASVGAPVQLMNGGVVPLFDGLGRY